MKLTFPEHNWDR